MTLVSNWKDAWRWWSVQLIVINGLLQAVWEAVPPEALAIIPQDWRGYITIGLLVMAAIARVIDQHLAEPAQKDAAE